MKLSQKTEILWGMFFSFTSSLLLQAGAPVYKEVLGKQLDYIFKDEKLKKTKVGVSVYSLSRNEPLYDYNSGEALSPASTIKILTSYVALKRLGTDFTFKTYLLTDGKIENGILNGNLYFKGGGDPGLVTERLYLMAEELGRWDIKKIKGDLIVDESIFSTQGDENRIIDNALDRPYNAPVNGLSFNYNTTTVYFRPGLKVGDKVRVYPAPDTGFLEIENRAKTVKGSLNALQASRQSIRGKEILVVSGSLGLNGGEQRSYFNIEQGALYAGHALRMMLREKNISLSGSIKKGPTPVQTKQLVEFNSQPLRELVLLMNKFSNNFMADSLVKIVGLEARGGPGSISKGLDVLSEEATALGINKNGFQITSGSGLARQDRICAQQFIDIFKTAYNNFTIFPELMSSLPIASVDGTLKKRMKDSAAAKRLRGKTGSIAGVSTLVGVVQSKGGELLAYAVLLNDQTAEPGSLKPWQNYLGQALSDFNRQSGAE